MMPFKIDDDFDKLHVGKIPSNERLQEYVVWLRKEIKVAEAELDARLNPHKVTLQPELLPPKSKPPLKRKKGK